MKLTVRNIRKYNVKRHIELNLSLSFDLRWAMLAREAVKPGKSSAVEENSHLPCYQRRLFQDRHEVMTLAPEKHINHLALSKWWVHVGLPIYSIFWKSQLAWSLWDTVKDIGGSIQGNLNLKSALHLVDWQYPMPSNGCCLSYLGNCLENSTPLLRHSTYSPK